MGVGHDTGFLAVWFLGLLLVLANEGAVLVKLALGEGPRGGGLPGVLGVVGRRQAGAGRGRLPGAGGSCTVRGKGQSINYVYVCNFVISFGASLNKYLSEQDLYRTV